MSAGASWPKTESELKKKKTVECRPFSIVSLPVQFEVVETNPAPDDAAHYRKTARRDESGRPKKKRKTTGKMPLSQVRLSGGEGKSERKKVKPGFAYQKSYGKKYLQGR